MDCEKIKEIIPAYINHSASEEEIGAIEEHLCVCNSCRQFLSQTMDTPQAKKAKGPDTQKISAGDYILMLIGAAVLAFFIFLLLKG